ncbi:MAG: hypothetical protein ACREFE_17210, partial [Limisphaerales bacterium]
MFVVSELRIEYVDFLTGANRKRELNQKICIFNYIGYHGFTNGQSWRIEMMKMFMKKTTLLGSRANGMAMDNDGFKRQLLATLASLKGGDFSVRLPRDLTGLDGKVADVFNEVVGRMERFG